MTDKRFDNRSKATFKKDIKFGTAMETYFFDKWVQSCDDRDDISSYICRDNGVGNDGEYVATGTNTSGADYMVDYFDSENGFTNLPLEVKWVPTAGKLSLKINDLRAYQKENAGILFIYNSVNCGTNFAITYFWQSINYVIDYVINLFFCKLTIGIILYLCNLLIV